MGAFAAGEVVLVRFPFSDLSQAKVRPAVVLAEADRDEWILCQITSKPYADARAIEISAVDFARGTLRLTSYARPGKVFTAHASLVAGQAGTLIPRKFTDVRDAVVLLIQTGR